MSRELTKKEIYDRMIELRNLRKLHIAQGERIAAQAVLIRKLKAERTEQNIRIAQLETQVSDLILQLEELRTIVFGKKKKRIDSDDDIPESRTGTTKKKVRTNSSYKRPVPKDDEVTEEVHHTLALCSDCGGTVTRDSIRTYYEEDIPQEQRTVRKHTVEQGHCTVCRRRVSGALLPCATVILGDTTKRYITYLSVVCRLSYRQVQNLLKETYQLTVSEGEIAKILMRTATTLRPHYERLLESIRGEPSVHLDETGWNLFVGDGMRRYAWTMVGGVSGDAVFTVGATRGKGNATNLLGTSTAVVVSDDYGAYRTLAQPHQLCCAHILRKARDLAQSRELGDEIRTHCTTAYHTFARIYEDITTAQVRSTPAMYYRGLLKRLTHFSTPQVQDPKKLAHIRKQVATRTKEYLTCLMYPHTRPDNNPAERSLRHLVLKRKVSFGSLNEATAERLAVLTSVLLTFKQRGTLRQYLQVGV